MFDQSTLMSEDELIKYLEMEFDYDDRQTELSKTKQSSDNTKSTESTYYKELIDKFKSDFPDIWSTINEETMATDKELIDDNKYILSLFIDILYTHSPKIQKIKKIFNKPHNSSKNLSLAFDGAVKSNTKPSTSQQNQSPVKFLGFTPIQQGGGNTFFLVDDILQLNDTGIDWCKTDQQNCQSDVDKFENFSDMLFRFIEYNDNNCIVKLIHPHDLYEQWGGEDSDDLIFPDKYLIKKDL
jgi:hypothetical protein